MKKANICLEIFEKCAEILRAQWKERYARRRGVDGALLLAPYLLISSDRCEKILHRFRNKVRAWLALRQMRGDLAARFPQTADPLVETDRISPVVSGWPLSSFSSDAAGLMQSCRTPEISAQNAAFSRVRLYII